MEPRKLAPRKEQPEPVRSAPAPWTLQGEAHALLIWLPASRKSIHRLGVLGFVRYLSSDVGPYDELLWLAPWGAGWDSRRFHTVERIFVSSRASRDNGRANWGVPKELARFDIQQVGASTRRVEVSNDAGMLASFLLATGGRSLKVNWAALPERLRTLGQELDGRRFLVKPDLRGRLHGARFSQLAGDNPDFVKLNGARPLAACSLLELEMIFPPAETRAVGQGSPRQ